MDGLADELLVQICQDFTSDELAKVARYNKKFSRIARTLLYSHCKLIPRQSTHQLWTVRRMLDTLVESPELGCHIQRIQVPGSCGHKVANSLVEQTRLSASESEAVQKTFPPLRLCPDEYQRDFSLRLGATDQDAMIATILMSCPNLNALVFGATNPCIMDWPCDEIRPRTDDFTDLAFPLTIRLVELATTPEFASSPLFKNLFSVTLDGCCGLDDVEHGWSLNVICIFLKLPTLRKFSAGGFRDLDDQDSLDCPEGSSTVTDLSLLHNRMSPETMRKVLRSCKALEKFRCERLCWDCGSGLSAEYDYKYTYTDVHIDLSRHRESLRRLVLHTKACGHPNLAPDECGPLHSLADLSLLEYVKVDEDALFGSHEYKFADRPLLHVLPANLERLIVLGEESIRSENSSMLDEYGSIVLSEHHRRLSTVELRRVRIEFVEADVTHHIAGVSVEEIPDHWNERYRHYSMRYNFVGSVLLYRSEQSDAGNSAKEDEDEEIVA